MHLTTASPVFKAMLSGTFKEGRTLRDAGSLELPLPDDDPEALVILLNVIHGRSRKVPRRIDLPMLTKLAILVDCYQLHEVVDVYSELWVTCVPEARQPQELFQYLCVCWVFRNSEGFAKITKRIIWELEGTVCEQHTRDLPIPERVIGKVPRKSVASPRSLSNSK